MRPLLLISDCHLSPHRRDSTADQLTAILESHPNDEVVFNGDTWDLSCASSSQSLDATLGQWLGQTPQLARALLQRVGRGTPVTIVTGNHDAELATPGFGARLQEMIGLQRAAPLRIAPWWTRHGGLHIEHGHAYDPDNAPLDPREPHQREGEPLGVALTRRFIAPSRAFAFAHAHETTPIAGLQRAIRLFGAQAPSIIADYYLTAFTLTAEAKQRQESPESTFRSQNLTSPSRRQPQPGDDIEQKLLELLPTPTHRSASATFKRLYLDRSIAFWGLLLGLPLAGVGAPLALLARGAAATGGAYLAFSLAQRRNRYAGTLAPRLQAAAEGVAEITSADFVIFGHTHQQVRLGRYVNLGSFGIPHGEQRHWARYDENANLQLKATPA